MKHLLLLFSVVAIFIVSFFPLRAFATPTFILTSPQNLSVCTNSTNNSINLFLRITDPTVAENDIWSILASPIHGSLAGFNDTINSTGGTLIPTGLSYTPTGGFSGIDSFKIQVTNGFVPSIMTIIVTVNPLPTAPTVVSPVQYCNFASASALTATGTSLLWYTASTGGTGSSTAPTPSTTTVGTTLFYVSQTVGGCESPRASISIIINPLPTSISISPTTAVICNGFDTTLTASGSGGLTFSWTPSGGLSSTFGSTVVASPSSNTTYTVTGTNGFGCSISTTRLVSVNPLPANITLSGTTLHSTCIGHQIHLLDGTTGGTWSSSNTSIATIVSGTGFLTGVDTGAATITYSLTLTGCYKTALISVNSDSAHLGTFYTCFGDTITVYDSHGVPWGTYDGSSIGIFNVVFTYSSGFGCELDYNVDVNSLPNSITGSNIVCIGSTDTLSDIDLSGTWSSSNLSIATIGAINGVVTGISIGIDTITYTLPTGCKTTTEITVFPLPIISVSPNKPTICIGSSITLNASGANTYVWANSSTLNSSTGISVTATPTVTITYTITGTDTNGCVNKTKDTVIVNLLPTLPIVTTPIQYCQNAIASALTATGSSLLWYSVPTGGIGSSTAPVPSTSTVSSTTYYVSQTVGGCESSRASIIVTINPAPTVSISPPTAMICVGLDTALTASGSGVSYAWTPAIGLSATTGLITHASPTTTTTYTVTSTGSNFCTKIATRVVSVNPLPTISITPANPTICFGNNSILTASGANTYTWSVPTTLSSSTGTIVTATPTITTTYTITGTDTNGCVNKTTDTVHVISIPSAPTITSPIQYCQNATSSALSAIGTGLLWYTVPTGGVGSSTAPVPSTTTVGTTTFYVSQTIGCESPRAAITVNILPLPTVTVSPATAIICNGHDTALTASGSGVSYVWTPATGLSATTGLITHASPTTSTTYTVTSTGSNFCTNIATRVVSVNPLPTISVTPSNPSICFGYNTTLTVSGANTYIWSLATTLSSSTGISVTANPTITTTYTITGTDGNGCVNTTTDTVHVNSLPTAPIVTSSINICQNATASALSAIGTGLLWYTVPTGGVGSSTDPIPSTTTVGTTTFYVSQTIGCESPRAAITVNILPLPTVTISPATAIICVGHDTALTASGSGISYVWTPATGLSGTTGLIVIANPTTTTTYTVTSTGSNFCTNIATRVVSVNPLPTISITPANPTICFGNNSILTASGANTYTWSLSTTLSSSTGVTVTATPAITTSYTITGTDGNGCVNTTTDTVNVNIIPSAPTVTSSISICQNATASALSATGTGLLWYTVPTGGIGSLTAPLPLTTSVGTTVYYVSQTIGGCESPRASITVIILPLPSITISPISAAICIGYDTSLTASGSSISYIWTPTTGLSSTTGSTVTASPSVTTIYTVLGTGSNGCTNTFSRLIIVYNPIISVTPTNPTICNHTNSTLTASGANTYTWANSSTLSSSIGTSVSATPTITTTYTITGTDINGCINSTTDIVNVNPIPPAPTVVSPIQYCQNTTDTPLSATGTALLWYIIPLGGTGSTTIPIPSTSTVGATTYYVSQTIAGCESPRDSIIVSILPLPTIIISPITAAICIGLDTTLNASGGISYVWTPSTGLVTTTGSTVIANPTSTITYTVTGVGTNNCNNTASRTVIVNPLPSIIITPTNPTICNHTNSTLIASGASSYSWAYAATLSSSTGTSVTATPTVTTTYTITGTDMNGCIDSVTEIVNVNPIPPAPSVISPVNYCPNYTSTALSATGTALLWYTVSSGGTGSSIAPTPATTTAGTTIYYVSQTIGGCESPRDSISVIINPLPANITGVSSVCAGLTTLFSDSTIGGTWSNGNTLIDTINSSGVIIGLTAGFDSITYTLPTGCFVLKSLTVNPLPNPITGFDSVCDGLTTTLSDLTTGGTWHSVDNSIATINSAGIVTGNNPGIDTISYTISTGCKVINLFTVNPLPSPLYGDLSVCVGSITTLTDSVGTIMYIIPGVVPGITTLTLSTLFGCSTHVAITVNPLPAHITGITGLCLGTTSILTDSTHGGTWSSNDTSIAFINDTGLVFARSLGTTTITYTLPTGCLRTRTVNVNLLFSISSLDTTNPTTCLGTNGAITLYGLGSGITYDVNYLLNGVPDTAIKTSNSLGVIILDSLTAGIYTNIRVSIGGCTSNSMDTLLVDPPHPSIPILASNSPLCTGSTLHLNSSDSTLGVSFSWIGTSGFTSSLQNSDISILSLSDSGFYELTVGINNCFSSDSIWVQVLTIPHGSIISGDSILCISSTTIFTDTILDTFTDTLLNKKWISYNTNATIDSISGILTGISYGWDTIIYRLTNICGSDTIIKNVFIERIPVVDTISGANFICVGSSVNLRDSTLGGIWSSNNSNATISSSGIVTGLFSGIDTILYTVTNFCGTTKVNKIISIISLPNSGTIVGDTSVCLGDTIKLADTIVGGIWSSSNGNANISFDGIVRGVTLGQDTISYSYTNLCGTDVTVKPIEIITLPNPGVIVGTSIVCIGASVIYIDSVVGGIWNTSNSNAVIDSTGMVNGILIGNDIIIYTVTNKCGFSITQKDITVFKPPHSHISIHSETNLCENTLYQNFGADIAPLSFVNYAWSAVNAEVYASSFNKQNCLISFHNSGKNIVILTAINSTNGCSSADSFITDIGGGISPNPEIVFYSPNEIVCLDGLADNYQWGYDDKSSLDSNLIQGEINQDIFLQNPDFDNKYYWVMTYHSGCLQKSYYNTPLEINNYDSANKISISVYPNPSDFIININIKGVQKSDKIEVGLYSILGVLINYKTLNYNGGYLDISSYPAGVYSIIFSINGIKTANRTLVKN